MPQKHLKAALSCLRICRPVLLISKNFIHLGYQGIAVNPMYHAGLFQRLSLRSRAA